MDQQEFTYLTDQRKILKMETVTFSKTESLQHSAQCTPKGMHTGIQLLQVSLFTDNFKYIM
jgi:hypothetical protein